MSKKRNFWARQSPLNSFDLFPYRAARECTSGPDLCKHTAIDALMMSLHLSSGIRPVHDDKTRCSVSHFIDTLCCTRSLIVANIYLHAWMFKTFLTYALLLLPLASCRGDSRGSDPHLGPPWTPWDVGWRLRGWHQLRFRKLGWFYISQRRLGRLLRTPIEIVTKLGSHIIVGPHVWGAKGASITWVQVKRLGARGSWHCTGVPLVDGSFTGRHLAITSRPNTEARHRPVQQQLFQVWLPVLGGVCRPPFRRHLANLRLLPRHAGDAHCLLGVLVNHNRITPTSFPDITKATACAPPHGQGQTEGV